MRQLTRWLTVAAAVMIVTSLGGCASQKEGRTVSEATAALHSMDGVAAGEVEVGRSLSGFTSSWGVSITFQPADDFDEVNKKVMFQRMLQIGWSVNEHKIDAGVAILLDDSSRPVNLLQAAEDADVPGVLRAGNLMSGFTVSSPVLQDEFGEWPGR